ncbi:MAG TPA: glycosyltransferase family 2 protein [Desulfobulbaceae bacterium]|nr:glycosyltransferase family 2 protein [Desulfobulbaceae bacterium]
MFFSVIVPLYNKRKYIRRCVDSVLGQSFPDFELIVVDDGSTDGSHEELADIQDPRFSLIRVSNMGGAGGQARNVGMENAAGEWFAFLDADDLWLPGHLDELRKVIGFYPDAGLISSGWREVADGTSLDNLEFPEKGRIRSIDYFLEASRVIGIVNCSSAAIKREVFLEIGGFSNFRSGPDLEYWVRIALKWTVAISDSITAIYFRGNNGNMEQIAKEKKSNTVKELRDFSPSVAWLCDHALDKTAIGNKESILIYVNSRIFNAVKGALYQGDYQSARYYSGFMKKPLNKIQKIWKRILYLPEILFVVLRRVFFLLKR